MQPVRRRALLGMAMGLAAGLIAGGNRPDARVQAAHFGPELHAIHTGTLRAALNESAGEGESFRGTPPYAATCRATIGPCGTIYRAALTSEQGPEHERDDERYGTIGPHTHSFDFLLVGQPGPEMVILPEGATLRALHGGTWAMEFAEG